ALKTELFPLAEIITPNLPEAEALSGLSIGNREDMLTAAERVGQLLPGAVLLKGGHLQDSADDLLWQNGRAQWFRAARVKNENNHGSGCTLSSAIACQLALGQTLAEAVARAKSYLTSAMEANLDLGVGSGPLNHCFAIREGGEEA
ncbi:MAG: bifunctional hydroxymethylpyrimidine kinase/phosphomethylpyrimidine kinase, partial [Oscillibacter sp.]